MKPLNPKLASLSNDELIDEMVARQSALFERMQAAIGLFGPPKATSALLATATKALKETAKEVAKAVPAKTAMKTAAASAKRAVTSKIVNEKSNKVYVLEILRAAKGSPLKTTQLVEKLLAAGWKTNSPKPNSIVYMALGELAKTGQAVMGEDKSWIAGPNAEAPTVAGKRGRKAKPVAPASTDTTDGTAIDDPSALLSSMDPKPAEPAPAPAAVPAADAAPPALRDGELLVHTPNGTHVIRRPGRAEEAAEGT